MYYKYDLKNGIIYDWTKFLMPIVITVIACISMNYEIISAEKHGLVDRNADFADLLIYIFKGEKPFAPESSDDFKFPFMWLIIQLSVAFIVGKYPFSEIYDNHGSMVLIKGKSRKKWMISKFIWIISVCLILYMLIIITAAIFSAAFGFSFNFMIESSQSYVYLCYDKTIKGVELLKLLILPLITSISLSALQTVVSLVFQPIYGFAFIFGLCGLSVFTDSIYALGSCSILIRNEIFYISDISTNKAFILLSLVFILSFVFSLVYFEKCDILQNRRSE